MCTKACYHFKIIFTRVRKVEWSQNGCWVTILWKHENLYKSSFYIFVRGKIFHPFQVPWEHRNEQWRKSTKLMRKSSIYAQHFLDGVFCSFPFFLSSHTFRMFWKTVPIHMNMMAKNCVYASKLRKILDALLRMRFPFRSIVGRFICTMRPHWEKKWEQHMLYASGINTICPSKWEGKAFSSLRCPFAISPSHNAVHQNLPQNHIFSTTNSYFRFIQRLLWLFFVTFPYYLHGIWWEFDKESFYCT